MNTKPKKVGRLAGACGGRLADVLIVLRLVCFGLCREARARPKGRARERAEARRLASS